MIAKTINYQAARTDARNSYGYGLRRRTAQVIETIDRLYPSARLAVVDFGCSEGAMLRLLRDHLGPRLSSSVGVDSFTGGAPAADDVLHFFVRHDFDKPELLPSWLRDTADVLVASSFLKHIEDPVRCLEEMNRVLRPGGHAIILDPSPWVLAIGRRVGRFLGGIHSPWDQDTIRGWLSEASTGLRVVDYRRYWLAPTWWSWWAERLVPGFLRRRLGMHQCIVLQKF